MVHDITIRRTHCLGNTEWAAKKNLCRCASSSLPDQPIPGSPAARRVRTRRPGRDPPDEGAWRLKRTFHAISACPDQSNSLRDRRVEGRGDGARAFPGTCPLEATGGQMSLVFSKIRENIKSYGPTVEIIKNRYK